MEKDKKCKIKECNTLICSRINKSGLCAKHCQIAWKRRNNVKIYKKYTKYYKDHAKKYYEDNKEKRSEQTRLNQNKRYREDEGFRIRKNLWGALWKVIDCYIKTGKILNPCKKYGIDWEGIIKVLSPIPKDRGKYHVDHIIQLSRFDLTDINQIQIAFAPENHRWLLAKDNLRRDRKE